MIGLLGSGSWATAIVKILLEDEEQRVNWWVREPEIIEGLEEEHHNPLYLSGAFLDTSRLYVSSDIADIVRRSDHLFLVIPSAFVASAFAGINPEMLKGKKIHSGVKGIVPETNQIVTDYLHDVLGVAYEDMTFFSGPSHAEETAQAKLTYLSVSAKNKALCEKVRQMLNCYYVRTVASEDMEGSEYATVMKNIYSVATGICRGLNYGDNLIAVLISNAMQEMDDFIQHFVPLGSRRLEQFAYLGDLLVTCYSQYSRNLRFGFMIGHGYSVKGAQMEMQMIAEGYYAVASIEKRRAEMGLSMPICESVYRILYNKETPRRVMKGVIESLR